MTFASKWSFSQKLIFANLAYLLPCAVLVFFLVKEKNYQLAFSGKERYGIEFHRPLINLLMNVGQHQALLPAARREESAAKEKMLVLRSQIETELGRLEELDAQYSEVLALGETELGARKRLSSSTKNIKASWRGILERSEQASLTEAHDLHQTLLSDLQGAIAHVGDSSNLILDPDLDSYYLMDITLIALPKTIDHLQQIISYFQAQKWDQENLSTEAIIQISTFAYQLRDDLMRIRGDIQTSVNEDKKFYDALTSLQRELPLHLKDFSHVLEPVIRGLESVLEKKSGLLPLEERQKLMQTTTAAIEESHTFWTRVASDLDRLIEIRMDQHAWERIVALVLSLLAWMPPALLALFTVHRLSRAFKGAVERLESEAIAAHASSSQLAAASSMVSSGSTEQAAAIQETGASMSEIASMIARSSSQAVRSQELAQKVTQKADEGCAVMERMVLSMESIHEANLLLQNISGVINEISTKTNVINDIVGKTQLLSFNASIEAARAGQHGRGFAVVAEEVGNLAQTSGNAAKSIRELIEDSQKQVSHILKTTIERVSEGKIVTSQAQSIFGDIAKDISMISSQVESVTEAAREQQLGIQQISKAMIQMDQTTQSNNKAAHLAAQLSDHLAGQSRKLTTIAYSVSELVFGDKLHGGRADTPRTEQAPADLRSFQDSRPSLKITRTPDVGTSSDAQLIEGLVRKGQTNDTAPTAAATPALSADDPSFREVG